MSKLETWEPIARKYDPLKAGSIDGTDTIPHDHGIVRAVQAEYKPNKLVVGNPKATIFVGRLNPSTTEDTLKKAFSKYGKIIRLRLIRDIVTGFSKGYAFIEYSSKRDAVNAVVKMDKEIIDDRAVLVDSECERLLSGWIPRRLGGGLSGKKESGQLRFGGVDRPFKRPLLPFKSKNQNEANTDSFNDRNRDSYNRRSPQRYNRHNRYREKHSDNYSSSYRNRSNFRD